MGPSVSYVERCPVHFGSVRHSAYNWNAFEQLQGEAGVDVQLYILPERSIIPRTFTIL